MHAEVAQAAPPVPNGRAAPLTAVADAAAKRPLLAAITLESVLLGLAFGFGATLRVWHIDHVGLNSDEAVYAGQAGAVADIGSLEPYFSAFRAHPLLFQTMLSFGYRLGEIDLWGRLLSAVIGIATVFLAYKLGKLLYGRRAGAIAALFMAVMPYHVLVTRQILLDGPMTLFATLTLYLVARYANDRRPAFLYAAATAMALAALSKETSLVLLGGIYAFFALAPEIKVRTRYVVTAGALLGFALATFPISLTLAGKAHTGGNYLAWQLFRRPNHEWTFYPSTVPHAIGYLVVLTALVGIWLLWRERSWRETLLLSWIAVPVAFFQIWPVKGFQYLLPIAPAVAVLAARTLTRWPELGVPGLPKLAASVRARELAERLAAPAVALIAISLLITTVSRLEPSADGKLLAGSGGLPGGRETGHWIRNHVPEGATFVTIGPSMANVIQFYGNRKAYGLSVSPNPLNRNPSYEPVVNPDRLIRDNEVQYLVWDSFSASRSKFFARSLKRYADRYNGRAAYMYATDVTTPDGSRVKKPLIVVYEVRP
jgi:hypothetical protein